MIEPNLAERDWYTTELLFIVEKAGESITFKQAIEMIDELKEERKKIQDALRGVVKGGNKEIWEDAGDVILN